MKIEQQVCTLEQAKQLQELGINQDSYFVISEGKMPGEPDIVTESWSVEGTEARFYAAFTVGELGEMLQAYSDIGHSFFSSFGKGWAHTWRIENKGLQPIISWFPTEAQARADMLIHLLKTRAITADHVNQRIN